MILLIFKNLRGGECTVKTKTYAISNIEWRIMGSEEVEYGVFALFVGS